MSFIEQFNYNRDSITSGNIVGFTGSPIYGSSITFSASNSSWRGSNYYQFVMPNGLNSIKAEMDFTFQGNKESMKSLLRRIEKATTGTITGDVAFSGTEDCINFGELKHGVQIDLDTDYYQNFSGSQISNYNLKHISSDVYELNVSMFNNRVSPVLNNGMGFVADRTVDISNSPFEKFDVIGRKVTGFTLDGVSGTDGSHVTGDWWWNPSTRGGERLVDSNDVIFEQHNLFRISDGDGNPYMYANQPNVDYPWNVTSWTIVHGNPSNLPVFSNFKYKKYNSNSFDDYFYLTDDRSSAVTASNISGLATYTGIADDATRTFFWEPDQQVSLPVDHGARISDFKGSFTQQLNISRNQNRIDVLDLKFANRSEKETYSILHFLESHLGYKQFVYYYDDDIIQQNRVFFCPQWKHTFNYKDSNTIEARFIEIVAPVTPQFVTQSYREPLTKLFPGATAAFSLTDLKENNGSTTVVRVRRSSNNEEMDFTAAQIDSGEMLSWVTEESATADGFVSVWYDQSGSGNDAREPNLSYQPKIVDAGSIVTDTDGKIAIKGTGAKLRLGHFSWQLESPREMLSADGTHSLFIVCDLPNQTLGNRNYNFISRFESTSTLPANQRPKVYLSRTNGKLLLAGEDNLSKAVVSSSDARSAQLVTDIVNPSANTNAARHSVYIDGAFNNAPSYGDTWTPDENTTLAANSSLFGRLETQVNTYISELIYYPSNQSANREAIEANIRNHYNIN